MPLPEIVPLVLAVCVAALFAGGFVKGVTGMGLPLVAVPVMALVTDVPVSGWVVARMIPASSPSPTRNCSGSSSASS